MYYQIIYNEACLRRPPVGQFKLTIYGEVAALPRYIARLLCYLMAVLERWLPNTVTILDRFH